MKKAEDIKRVAGIGGGIIGGSWAVLFAMKGKEVRPACPFHRLQKRQFIRNAASAR